MKRWTRPVSWASSLSGLALLAALISPATSAATTQQGRAAAPRATIGTNTLLVKWKGTDANPKYQDRIRVPGIGSLVGVCRRDNTQLRLEVDDRSRETQMWMSKYEVKRGTNVVAVKTGRVYTYDTASDDGTGGTGWKTHEGLNQKSPPENWASGYAHGLISQRGGRNVAVGADALTPTTSFFLTWYWNGFSHPKRYRSCTLRVQTRTSYAPIAGVNWHGDADAVAGQTRTTTYAVGDLDVTCQPTRQGARRIWLTPVEPSTFVTGFTIQGEGNVEYQVVREDFDRDPLTGRIGPIDLPNNGMLRLFVKDDRDGAGGQAPVVRQGLIVSSLWKVNSDADPTLNRCEVAVGDLFRNR